MRYVRMFLFFEIIFNASSWKLRESLISSTILYFCILFSVKSASGFPPEPACNSRNTKPGFFVFTTLILSFHEQRPQIPQWSMHKHKLGGIRPHYLVNLSLQNPFFLFLTGCHRNLANAICKPNVRTSCAMGREMVKNNYWLSQALLLWETLGIFSRVKELCS